MHKIMLTAAAAALIGTVSAIESANVVGYQTQTLASGAGKFTMVNVPFVHVNDTKGFSIDTDLALTGKYGDPDNEKSKSDQIWVWDETKAGGIGGYNRFYWDVGFDDPNDGWDAGWYEYVYEEDVFSDVYPNGLPVGGSFFFQNSQAIAKPMSVSGAVESEDEVEISLAAGVGKFTMPANPYPTTTDIDTLDVNGKYGDPDNSKSKSDQIWIWDAEKSGGIGGYNRFYWDVGYDDPNEGWDAGWYEYVYEEQVFADIYPNGIPMGIPFFFQNAQDVAKSVTFVSPLAK